MRINKYLALHGYATRRGADVLISEGRVSLNGKRAALGDNVEEGDVVEVKGAKKTYRYFAYHKPRGVITHSPQGEEESIADIVDLKNVFPIGRLDKDSSGLIILTDDGRITERLLGPAYAHEKEYEVTCLDDLPPNFKSKMERGVDIGDYITAPCTVEIVGDKTFSITLTEGKKHQIRRMCGVFGVSAVELKRVRIMNITLGRLAPGAYRAIQGLELKTLLTDIGMEG